MGWDVRAGPRLPRIAGLAVTMGDPARRSVRRSSTSAWRRTSSRRGPSADRASGASLNLDAEFLARNLQGRTEPIEQALDQSIEAIDQLDLDRRTIGTVLTSSFYSLGCPTLAHRLIEHYRLEPATDKYHVTAVGCASAVPLFRLAAQILHANPSRDVLVVAAESMSSTLMPSRRTIRARRRSARRSSVMAALLCGSAVGAMRADR